MIELKLNRKYLKKSNFRTLNRQLTIIRYRINEMSGKRLSVSFPDDLEDNYFLRTSGLDLLEGVAIHPLVIEFFGHNNQGETYP